ncbi:YceD family protein [Fulvivirga sedimenti]|uniref:DUF177 domain-containing protein n=1 Tax=Fulvivirga sedimenti TaxID=2879465 RepID=A0A9X1KVL6_9BACT|nr:DUF177 domain-containing protein [Fulvivirga sedimenti]
MKSKEKYSVDIFRLKPGTYSYEFGIDADLFQQFEGSPVTNASGKVFLTLTKQESLIRAEMDFKVGLPLVCDRSLREFTYDMNEAHEVLFKFGDEEMEMDDDVYIITRNTQRIDFSGFIYEFIILAVPMKKVHPDLEDESEEEIIYTSETEHTEDNDSDETDPRWEMLKKLKKN